MAYRKDIEAAWAHVRSISSRKLETTSGTVEYAVEGAGPPVLMSHGILGCHTEGIGMVRTYFGTDCMAISPSRFGYFSSTTSRSTEPL
jgi:hypothetical protein